MPVELDRFRRYDDAAAKGCEWLNVNDDAAAKRVPPPADSAGKSKRAIKCESPYVFTRHTLIADARAHVASLGLRWEDVELVAEIGICRADPVVASKQLQTFEIKGAPCYHWVIGDDGRGLGHVLKHLRMYRRNERARYAKFFFRLKAA